MSKNGKTNRVKAPTPLRMQRHTQRAHKFTDRKKAANKKAARGKVQW